MPWEPRRGIRPASPRCRPGALLPQAEAARSTAGRSWGSSASSAARTAAVNRRGARITRSTRKVCPASRSDPLAIEVDDRLPHLGQRARPDPGPAVQHPVDGGVAQPGLLRDLPQPVRVPLVPPVPTALPSPDFCAAVVSNSCCCSRTVPHPPDVDGFLMVVQAVGEALTLPQLRPYPHTDAEETTMTVTTRPTTTRPGPLHRGRLLARGLRRAGRAGRRSWRTTRTRPRWCRTCWSTTPRPCAGDRPDDGRLEVEAELVRAFTAGPGVVAFQGAFADHGRRRPRHAAFEEIIAAERAAGRWSQRPLRQGRRQRPDLERAGEARRARPGDVRRLLRQRPAGAGLHRLARPGLPGDLAGQRRPARRPGPGPAPRLPPGLPVQRDRGPLPGPRAPALPRADAAGCGRALRHAGRERPDDVPAVLAPVRARLPGLAAAGVPGALRRPVRPAAAGQGRRRVLQSGPVPRRGHQRVRRRAADGEPAAGVLGFRSGHGDRRPGQGVPGGLPRAEGPPGRRHRGGVAESGAGLRRRGLPVPQQPGSRRQRRRAHPPVSGSGRPAGSGRGLERRASRPGATAYDVRHRTDEV